MLRSERMLDAVAAFLHAIRIWELTILDLPTAYWHLLTATLDAEALTFPASPRLVIIGGEAARPEALANWRKRVGSNVRLVNTYGPTETTVVATMDRIDTDPETPEVSIGRAVPHLQTYVLDTHLQPVPIGVCGELYIGGAGITRGYLHQPALTAEHFIPHIFSAAPGMRLYRTGDVVRYRPGGELTFIGRRDRQVKLRGYRIELGEIETVFNRHPAVQAAVVMHRETAPGQGRLAAYIVRHTTSEKLAAEPSRTDLQAFLQTQLPAHMVPADFIWLEALPMTDAHKVDLRALPPPAPVRPELAEAFVAPRTPSEEMLASIWTTVLGIESIGVHDHFFALGGHSLMAMQVMARLRDSWSVEIPLRTLFEAPTIAALAQRLDAAAWDEGDDSKTPMLAILPASRTEPAPLSIGQERLWQLDQALFGLPFFNITTAMRAQGPLNLAALEHSFNDVIKRHDILRTTFDVVDDRPVSIIAPSLDLNIEVDDLQEWSTAKQEDHVQQRIFAESRWPLELSEGPLLRVCVLRLAPQAHVLIITAHHIISDGWSTDVLGRELAILYDAASRNTPARLPALPLQYTDFAHWQRQWLQTDAAQRQLNFWLRTLADPLPVPKLPTDRPRTAKLYGFPKPHTVKLPRTLTKALHQLGREVGCTLFMTLLAALKTLLYHHTGQTDIRVSTLAANRQPPEVEGLIGLFVNTVIMRTDLSGNPTLRQVLQRVRATALAAYAHQQLPVEKLIETLGRERGLDRSSLFQVMLILQNVGHQPFRLASLQLDPIPSRQANLTTYDLVLTLSDTPDGLMGICLYQPDLFDLATIMRLFGDFKHVLNCLTTQLDQPLSSIGI